ncbi:nuclear transport factor 2 family protein [Nocardioides daejeonensis]|uniref:nuclear transport factor 2 family protein n=1 Tax=Nocardioides daejeonensis TaxID=1046556 RepID=UPI000D7496C3|nr:nuclear transport factor 2 family protein [Nocardioides daejeonensis]
MSANIESLKNAFSAADAGDAGPLVALYDDNLSWAGFTLEGTQTVYTKASFLEAFGVLAKLDESANQVLDATETPEGIVTATLRLYRRLGEKELDVQGVFTHRFVDGKVTHGSDVVPAEFDRFWAETGLAG